MPEETPAPRRIQVKILPSVEVLEATFDLDRERGILRWKKNRGGPRKADRLAGSRDRYGYLKVRLDGHEYRYHRIVWKMMYRKEPPPFLDHGNTLKADNQPENLRAATKSQNNANSSLRRNNTSGVKGVWWSKSRNRWCAVIKLGGRKAWKRRFKSFDEAVAAVREARERLHGEFANHG